MDERIRKAMLAIEEERIDEAIRILEPMAKEYNPEPDALVYLGIAYVQDERPEDAIKVFRQAQDIAEDHCVVALFLGRALRGLGKLDEAEEELRRAISLDPEGPESWIELGKLLYDKGNYRDTVRIMEEAILLFPDDLSLRGTNALALHRLGDFTEATLEWETLYKLSPELMAARTNYAYTLLLQNRMDDALPLVDSTYSMDPTDYRSLVLKGIVALSKNEIQEAKNYFERVLKVEPENVQALSRLAVIYHEEGKTALCDKYLKVAEQYIDASTECWRGLCYAYSELNMYSEHMACLTKWSQNDPGAAAPWIAIAIEYNRISKKDEALNAWRKAMSLRGYIRINCPSCGNSSKFDFESYDDFNPFADAECSKCGENIPMPRGLLTF
ncbi:MAG: tetratricopeptide repeat protein [Candidatus Thorarchaeota archaeon]|nr:tetratricopeptide repeat protein [Candidatus Thorarchaeota archaeon]